MQNQVAESLKNSLMYHNASDTQQKLNAATTWDFWTWITFFETAGLTFFGVLGAFLCMIVFVMYFSKKSLRTQGNTFVLSVTTSDFLRGVFLLPIYIIRMEGSITGELFCMGNNFLNLWINIAAVHSLLLIAMDRNCAVKDPIHYVKNNSKRQAKFSVICVWILSVLLALPALFGFPEFDYKSCDLKVTVTRSIFDPVFIYEFTITFTAFIVPLSCVACLYYNICKAAKSNIDRNGRNSCSSYGSSDAILNMKLPRCCEDSETNLRRHMYITEENYQQNNQFLRKHRSAVTGLLAVVSLIVCFTPYFTVRFYQQFSMMTIGTNFWVYFPTFISTIIHPYIYFYRNRSTRMYAKKLAARIFHM